MFGSILANQCESDDMTFGTYRSGEDHRLLQTQLNEVLDLFQRYPAFDPTAEFDWGEEMGTEGHLVSFLRYEPEPQFRFKFDWNAYGWVADYSPGDNKQRDAISVSTWDSELNAASRWLAYLQRQVKAVDRWAQLREQIGHMDVVTPDGRWPESRFSREEARELHLRVQQITVHIRQNFNLHPDRLALIEGQLDKLDKKIDDSGRTTWYQLAIGIMASIYLAVDPTQAQQIWELTKQLVAPLRILLLGH
jgi:hypothetical protein